MLGPVFVREVSLAPKRPKFFLGRSLFALALLVLICTGYLLVAGTQPLRTSGDLARFGVWMFQLLAPLQLAVLTFQAALGATSTVAVEKDRRTLILLLLTRITGAELVAGKLTAGVIGPLSMLASALPVFLSLTLMGGVSLSQVFAVEIVTAAAVMLSGAVGVTVALWREKTFQSVAVTILSLVLWLAACEVLASGLIPSLPPEIGQSLSPVRALIAAAQPLAVDNTLLPPAVLLHFAFAVAATIALCVFAAYKLRVWNPTREVRLVSAGDQGEADERTASWKVREARQVWDNPVLWREMCTWAYGRKVVFVRLAYFAFFVMTLAAVFRAAQSPEQFVNVEGSIPPVALAMAPLLIVSLVIVNALAVSSVVTERDVLAIDLLLVSDMSPKEFIFGKLFGVLYVTKDVWALPMILFGICWWNNLLTAENLLFAILGSVCLNIFAAALGLHCGLNYANSRSATLTSLGTIFFQCLGVATCMVIMVGFRGSFGLQLAPFLAVIVGGGAGIYAALGWRRPSSALLSASFGLPFLTFYAITAFLLRLPLPVLLAVLFAYGFATAAMLLPAVSEFDVAMGRTRAGQEDGG